MFEIFQIGIILGSPIFLLFIPWKKIKYAVPVVIILQALCVYASACSAYMLHCPSFCYMFYPACEDPNDDKDWAPFGVFIVAVLGALAHISVLLIRLSIKYISSKIRSSRNA